MNETPKNRRLQIMPEVLPAPTKAVTTTDVRSRTLSHMQRMLATAAVLPLASCTKTDTQGTQTVTIPSASASVADTAEAGATQGSLLPPPTSTPTAKPTVTAPDMGYAVVDPMPAPARCIGLAAATVTTGVFKKDAGGLYLEITATIPTGATLSGTTFTTGSTPSAYPGTVISSQVTSNRATVKIRPTANMTSVGVQLSISCPAGPGSVSLTASFTGTPTETTKTTFQKYDY